ncbi:MAG: NAD(P)-dependent oxidoreductase [Planctomycetota bacterium]
MHVLVSPEPEDLEVLLKELDPGITVTTGEIGAAADFEVLVAGRPGREHLAASPRIRVLAIPYAGLPAETRDLLGEFPHVAVGNLHHNAAATAESAVGLLLAAAKALLPVDRAMRRNDWSGRGRDTPALLLHGKAALVLGFGALGRRVAAALRALGMEVLAVRRRPGRRSIVDGVEVRPVSALRDLLPRATALVVCVPLTDETRGLIGEEEIALLPRGAVLVNVSRGPIVAEGPLYEALRTGHLQSAGIDVWYRYPGREGDPKDTPPSEYPFGELENVVMSPHRAGWVPEIEAWRMRHLAAFLNVVARGREIPDPVDLDAGY